MRGWIAAIVVSAGLLVAGAVHAEVPQLDGFLEQRVPEELAADGIVLAQHGVVLDVETIGDRLLVVLLDAATGAPRASTRLDAVPPDREAAVASVVQVVTTLLAAGLPPAPPPTAITPPPMEPEPAPAALAPPGGTAEDPDLAARRSAYEAEAIDFWIEGKVYQSRTGTRTAFESAPYVGVGAARHRMSTEEFYAAIGRPEVFAKKRRRHRIAVGIGFAALASLMTTFVLVSRVDPDQGLSDPSATAAICTLVGTGLLGATALVVSDTGRTYTPQQESVLAERYNARLRAKYRLPEPADEPSASLAPYVAPGGGGLALRGRF